MPSTPRGQRTRQLIIERTARVFDAYGFAGATLAQLVDATGLTRGAFYFHFESKDALAEAIVQVQQERVLPIIDDLEASEADPMRRLVLLSFRSAELFVGDHVVRAGSRLMTERSLIRRELWISYPWWLATVSRLLTEAREDLADFSTLPSSVWPVPTEDSARRVTVALAENLLASWTGISQLANAGGLRELPDRWRTDWMFSLHRLCRDPGRCEQLTLFVEDLADRLRETAQQSAETAQPTTQPKVLAGRG
jgi:AcrR family transcriptional regulator